METYQIRINGVTALLPGDNSRPTIFMTEDFSTREEAINWYNRVRAATNSQQVTLYGPEGNKIREAMGTA